jgi:hypothetical protein
MTYRCKFLKEETCETLNKHLGDCEIMDDEGTIVWRCSNYIKVDEAEEENKKEMGCGMKLPSILTGHTFEDCQNYIEGLKGNNTASGFRKQNLSSSEENKKEKGGK